MASPTYDAIAFLQSGSDCHLGGAARRLSNRFRHMQVTHDGKEITISAKAWQVTLHLAEGPLVAEESREMGEHFTRCPRASDIAKCERRVDIWSTDPDPNMDHFNDFILVLETLEEYRGIILFDAKTGDLI
jgi:hypothetical protein